MKRLLIQRIEGQWALSQKTRKVWATVAAHTSAPAPVPWSGSCQGLRWPRCPWAYAMALPNPLVRLGCGEVREGPPESFLCQWAQKVPGVGPAST